MLDDQAATISTLKRQIEELQTQVAYYDDELIPQYVTAVEESQGLTAAESSQYEEEIAQLKEVIVVLQAQCARNKDIENIYNTLIAKYSSEL
jgi:cell division septum initiation protein DivIVA